MLRVNNKTELTAVTSLFALCNSRLALQSVDSENSKIRGSDLCESHKSMSAITIENLIIFCCKWLGLGFLPVTWRREDMKIKAVKTIILKDEQSEEVKQNFLYQINAKEFKNWKQNYNHC